MLLLLGCRPHLTVTLLAQLARMLQGALSAQMFIIQIRIRYIMALYGTTMDETLYIYAILTKIAQAKKYPRMNNAQAVWVTPIVLNILKQSPPLPVRRRLSPTIPLSGILSRSQAFSSRSLAFSSRSLAFSSRSLAFSSR